MPGELEVCQHLGFVHGEQRFNRLQLDHDTPTHKQVQPETGIQHNSIIDNRKGDLALNPQLALTELMA